MSRQRVYQTFIASEMEHFHQQILYPHVNLRERQIKIQVKFK